MTKITSFGTRVPLGVPGYLPEYDLNNQVWYPYGYPGTGTYPRMTETQAYNSGCWWRSEIVLVWRLWGYRTDPVGFLDVRCDRRMVDETRALCVYSSGRYRNRRVVVGVGGRGGWWGWR